MIRAVYQAAEFYHNEWVSIKRQEGWTYGVLHSEALKEDSLVISWINLPNRIKYDLIAQMENLFRYLGISLDMTIEDIEGCMG